MSTDQSSEEYAGPSKIGNSSAKALLVAQLALIPHVMGSRTMATVTSLAGLIVGAVWGWNQAEKTEQQFRGMKESITKLNAENQALKNDAKWAERLANRPPEDKLQVR